MIHFSAAKATAATDPDRVGVRSRGASDGRDMAALHDVLGNRGMRRTLVRNRANTAVFSPDWSNRSQAEFSREAVPTPPRIQAKLAIGPVDDPLEREADQIAEQVMRTPETGDTLAAAPSRLSRNSATGTAVRQTQQTSLRQSSEAAAGEVATGLGEAPLSPGQALDPATRVFMEARFGQDFGSVLVHTDNRAADSARSINAVAYTVGSDVVFGAGQYAPATAAGRKLLAHELAHTIQQQAGHGAAWILRQPIAGPPASTDVAGPPDPRSPIQQRLNEFQDRMRASYHTPDGAIANVAPPFGMGAGYPEQQATVQDATHKVHLENVKKKAPRIAQIYYSRVKYARGSSAEIQAVTQALLDDRALEPGAASLEARIRKMMFDYMIGTDCAGYVQQAYLYAEQRDRGTAKFNPRIDLEDLGNLSQQGFSRIMDPAATEPGDIVVLDPPGGGQPGHRCVVYSQYPATADDKQQLRSKNPPASFVDGGPMYVLEIDSSWGSGGYPEMGGIQRRTFWYNPLGTPKWLWTENSPNLVKFSERMYDHPLQGFYRKKASP